MNLGYKIIACDFDGTLCENAWPEIGEVKEDVVWYMKKHQAEGDKIILWTCRTGELLDAAVKWCEDQGLIFDAINENLPEIIETMGGDTRKIYADEYVDDKNKSVGSLTFERLIDEVDDSVYESLTTRTNVMTSDEIRAAMKHT